MLPTPVPSAQLTMAHASRALALHLGPARRSRQARATADVRPATELTDSRTADNGHVADSLGTDTSYTVHGAVPSWCAFHRAGIGVARIRHRRAIPQTRRRRLGQWPSALRRACCTALRVRCALDLACSD